MPGSSRPSQRQMPIRERSSSSPVMPPLASVRQSDGIGIGPELSQRAGPACDRCGAPRHILVQRCPHGEHATWIVPRQKSAAHHGFLRAKRRIRCTAIRAPRIGCLICRRSTGTAAHPIAYELCMVGGSASLYCTISKRWLARSKHRDLAPALRLRRTDAGGASR